MRSTLRISHNDRRTTGKCSAMSAMNRAIPFVGDAAQAAAATVPMLARWRVITSYLWRHRRYPDLDAPTRFTELVQRRKLTDRSAR